MNIYEFAKGWLFGLSQDMKCGSSLGSFGIDKIRVVPE